MGATRGSGGPSSADDGQHRRLAGLPPGVWWAVGTVGVVLTALSGRYGPSRDELYFAMLEPAWGYVDQPPLAPLIAQALTANPWLLRIPATLLAAGGVLLVVMIAREVGGSRWQLVWTGWATAGTAAVLSFGHFFLTATLDLVIWPLIVWLVVGAELRSRPRWWILAGLAAGVATFFKLLVAVLLVGIAVGLLVTAPRRLVSREVLGSALITVAIASPNLLYQAVEGWPQLEMGRALSEHNAGDVRWFMWVLLLLMLGPPLAYVWGRGLVALWRPQGRPIRFLVPAVVVVLGFTFIGGSQPYYPTFLLLPLLGVGVVACGDTLRPPVWRILVAVNAAVAVLVSLPVLPVTWVARTPILGMNTPAADSIGWRAYADQIERVAAEHDRPVVIASNYGEAGALAYYTDLTVYSGHNQLYEEDRPPADTHRVVLVGDASSEVLDAFASCRVVTELDNGVGADNEEQGQPVRICSGPTASWQQLWPRFRHLD